MKAKTVKKKNLSYNAPATNERGMTLDELIGGLELHGVVFVLYKSKLHEITMRKVVYEKETNKDKTQETC